MRFFAFARRNRMELLRDPVDLACGLGFPAGMLVLLSVLNRSISQSQSMFAPQRLIPGIAMFGYTFLTLFLGMLLSQDRSGSFVVRLKSSPLTAADFFLGYLIPMLPIGIIQSLICFAGGVVFGLEVSWRLLAAVAFLLPSLILFLALGMIFGCLFGDRSVGGISSILINLSTICAGVWFPLDAMEGSVFYKICSALPFLHCVKASVFALSGSFAEAFAQAGIVAIWAAVFTGLSVYVFSRSMSRSI